MAEIVVVDYHKGNLLSVERGLAAAGANVRVSDDPSVIAKADAIVLPGVGAFADAMEYIEASGQGDVMRTMVAAGTPFLGICLGMQLLFARGNEGVPQDAEEPFVNGLGIFEGSCIRMPDRGLKIPHVGWDQVKAVMGPDGQPVCPLLRGIPDEGNYYFTHSYVASADDDSVVTGWTDYGDPLPAVVSRDAVFGCQFHPEKSSGKGLAILSNFVDIVSGTREV